MDERDHEHTSWRDDLRVDAVQEVLNRVLGSVEAAEVEMPHIVICCDEETGSETYSGPFPSGLAALVFAESECAVDRELNDGTPLRFRVAALYSAEHRNAS